MIDEENINQTILEYAENKYGEPLEIISFASYFSDTDSHRFTRIQGCIVCVYQEDTAADG